MPAIKKFKKGSIIYFDGERKNNNVYLLKQGACQREMIDFETLLPKKTRIKEGEFFGIKAAMGVTMRDETVSCNSDSLVYMFSPKEFEQLISKNISIILKMLKNFSNELRRIHYGIEKVIGKAAAGSGLEDISTNLYETAQFYFENGSYQIAIYGFQKFIEQYAGDARIDDAKNMIQQAKDFLSGNASEQSASPEAADTADSTEDSDGFNLFETSVSYAPEPGGKKLSDHFNVILELYGNKNFSEAFKKISALEEKLPETPQQSPLYEKIYLTIARLYFYKGDYSSAINKAKLFASNFNSSAYMPDALIIIAASYLKAGSKDNAQAVFRKALAANIPEDQKKQLAEHYKSIWGS